MDWATVEDDDGTILTATLYGADGAVEDLTGASVVLLTRARGTSDAAASAACSISSPATAGVVTVTPTFATPGDYEAEFEVTFGDATVATWPSDRPLIFRVRPALN